MSEYQEYYRSSDGYADYLFGFQEQSDGTWRVYILEQPSYQGRSENAHITHRLSSWGRKYICWTTALHSYEQATQVASMWADKTQEYIRTGCRF